MSINTTLSERYAAPGYRATRRRAARWTKLTPRAGAMCTECVQMQHETHNGYKTRQRPKERRTVGEAELLLCTGHAEAWRERDKGDKA